MKRMRQDRAVAARQGDEMFLGDAFLQKLVTEEDAPSLRVTAVTFEDGARNRWHTHSTEQVLIVTAGSGVVVSRSDHYDVEPGDVVLIAPGEEHWHGAREGDSMTHLAILLPGSMRIIEAPPGG